MMRSTSWSTAAEWGTYRIVDPPQLGRATERAQSLPDTNRQFSWAEADRYKERTMIERASTGA